MGGDFVQVGDVFNVEGQRYYVLDVDSPRSVTLGKLLTNLTMEDRARYRFSINGGTVVWDKVALEWVIKGGRLESL